MKLADIILNYLKNQNTESLRDTLLNYSKTTIGIRNRGGSTGWVARDQGQAEGYAGCSHLYLCNTGQALLTSRDVGLAGMSIFLRAAAIEQLYIQGRTINKTAHEGRKMFSIRPGAEELLRNLYFVGEPPQVDSSGRLLNPIPVLSIVEPLSVFDTPSDMEPPEIEIFRMLDGVL